jgi:nucleotide-binding universal stress UspA family protein
MKNILVLVHDDPGQEARLQAALDIARALRGHLKCLDVTAMIAAPADPVIINAGAVLLAEERQRESVNKARIQKRLAVEDVSWEWADVTGWLPKCIEDAATLADVIVVNRRLDEEPYPDMLHIASQLIVGSGKPIVAVPEQGRGFLAAGRALVAWDGSDEAAAALAAAVPLLAIAESVAVVEVEDGSVNAHAEEAAAYLSRHGVSADVVRIDANAEGASSIILREAASGRFDWVVMGGFGRPRFVEALFGGVTRRMLSESPVPLFLAH